jgi:hypothetical protein
LMSLVTGLFFLVLLLNQRCQLDCVITVLVTSFFCNIHCKETVQHVQGQVTKLLP